MTELPLLKEFMLIKPVNIKSVMVVTIAFLQIKVLSFKRFFAILNIAILNINSDDYVALLVGLAKAKP